MNHLEKLDRRAFLRGLTVTSAGLLVPKAVQVFMPSEKSVFVESDFAFGEQHVVISRIHDSVIIEAPTEAEGASVLLAIIERNRRLFQYIHSLPVTTCRTQTLWPNCSNTPKPA